MRSVAWSRMGSLGLEVCQIATEPSLALAGTVVAWDERPRAVSYQVATYCDGTTREAEVTVTGPGGSRRLHLQRSAAGWQRMTPDGTWCPLPALGESVGLSINDVDLEWTPATNTLPLRRLQLAVGSSATVGTAWVRWPSLDVQPLVQRYTRTAARRYRYESLASGFSAELTVDGDGVVIWYEGLWQARRSAPPALPAGFAHPTLGDFFYLVREVDAWWGGRPITQLLPRYLFEHFADTSWVIREGGRPIAFLVGFRSTSRPDEGYAHMLGVHPAHRGRGLARQLYQTFFDAMRQQGVVRIRAVTSATNVDSIRFHTRLGFALEPGDLEVAGYAATANHDGRGGARVSFVKELDMSD